MHGTGETVSNGLSDAEEFGITDIIKIRFHLAYKRFRLNRDRSRITSNYTLFHL